MNHTFRKMMSQMYMPMCMCKACHVQKCGSFLFPD